jgi:hypothetical protein
VAHVRFKREVERKVSLKIEIDSTNHLMIWYLLAVMLTFACGGRAGLWKGASNIICASHCVDTMGSSGGPVTKTVVAAACVCWECRVGRPWASQSQLQWIAVYMLSRTPLGQRP